jgi:hypothetical protein
VKTARENSIKLLDISTFCVHMSNGVISQAQPLISQHKFEKKTTFQIMPTYKMNSDVHQTPETSFISHILQTLDSVQLNNIINYSQL